MLMTKERRCAIRTLRGWAISVLLEAGAIVHLVRQQPVALLHRPLELPEQGSVARIQPREQAIEKAPAVRRRAREQAIHGWRQPDHLDMVGERP